VMAIILLLGHGDKPIHINLLKADRIGKQGYTRIETVYSTLDFVQLIHAGYCRKHGSQEYLITQKKWEC
jgi:hypothetical protein